MPNTKTSLSKPTRLHRVIPIITTFMALIACDSPSPHFRTGDARTYDMQVEGARFKIHQREDWVESYRINAEVLPSKTSVLHRAKIAIEMATGCPIREGTLSGDQGIQRAQLNCGRDLPPAKTPVLVDFNCEIYDHWPHSDDRVVMENIECTPITSRAQ